MGTTDNGAPPENVDLIVSGLRAKVFRYIRGEGFAGATCDEIEEALDMRHQTASPRVRELVLMGAIEDSGHRRRTRSGSTARVYVLGGTRVRLLLQ